MKLTNAAKSLETLKEHSTLHISFSELEKNYLPLQNYPQVTPQR